MSKTEKNTNQEMKKKNFETNTRQWEFNYLWSSNGFRIEANISLS